MARSFIFLSPFCLVQAAHPPAPDVDPYEWVPGVFAKTPAPEEPQREEQQPQAQEQLTQAEEEQPKAEEQQPKAEEQQPQSEVTVGLQWSPGAHPLNTPPQYTCVACLRTTALPASLVSM